MLVALFSISAFCQDTIHTVSGEIINGKVLEVNQTEVKYKTATNSDGPVYVKNKFDIALIEYKNGEKDYFYHSPSATISTSYSTGQNYNVTTNVVEVKTINNLKQIDAPSTYVVNQTPQPKNDFNVGKAIILLLDIFLNAPSCNTRHNNSCNYNTTHNYHCNNKSHW